MIEVKESAFFFYFDVVGITSALADDLDGTVSRLREWQEKVRLRADVAAPGSTVTTMLDNVVARVSAVEGDKVLQVADVAVTSLREARFENFFAVIAYGDYQTDLTAMLTTGSQATDIRTQHLEFLSDPWLRCAMAEKWLQKHHSQLPLDGKAIWISEEVLPRLEGQRPELLSLPTADLGGLAVNGKPWPFGLSKFHLWQP